MNGFINISIIGFYNIFRLCCLQLRIVDLRFLFMVPLNHSLFQNIYCKCLPGNFIIAWWVPEKRVDLRSQEMPTII